MVPTIYEVRDKLNILENRPYYELRNPATCNLLVVHHDAVFDPGLDTYDKSMARILQHNRYHKQKNWGKPNAPAFGHGIMYHYFLTEYGLFRVRNENEVTWNAMNANRQDIAICLSGGSEQPSQRILDWLHEFLMWMCYFRPDLPLIVRKDTYGHGELVKFGNQTECPGPVKPYVIKWRQSEW